ncbi:MAG: DUF1987 domain-containing protein [Salinivirgaceae bacterium]|nr:DUF1987 domain-containing protein [Salinivirgaceae bacterium]
MKPLFREGTSTTLKVSLDKEANHFEFSGKSRPENAVSFFEPIFEWFDDYCKFPNNETIIIFKLDYFNSSSAKVLLRFLVKLEEFKKSGHTIEIHWYYLYNDEDMWIIRSKPCHSFR